MTTNKTMTLPTAEELAGQLAEANEALRLVRIAVHNGTADSRELDEAEQAVRFAQTRIDAAEDARQEAANQANVATAKALAERLRALDDVKARQADRLAAARDVLADYLNDASHIRSEVENVYWGVHDLRQWTGRLPDGFRIGPMPTSVTFDGETYFGPDGVLQLRQWLSEVQASGGTMAKRGKE